MYSDSIVSLCYMSKQYEKSVVLCRIADFCNGRFEPYEYDSTYDFYGTERDLIYGLRKELSGEIGSIAMYAWSAYQESNNEWRTSTCESEMPWVEVISSFRNSPDEIVEMIKSGIKLTLSTSKKHDIIVCCSAKGSYCEAVYIPSGALMQSNDRYTFASNVINLETGQINYYEDTASCRCRYFPSDTVRFLIRPGSWRATGTVVVQSVREIVSSAVLTYARQLDKMHTITRKERQSFCAVMDKLSADTLSDEVMAKTGCNRDDALKYIMECLSTLNERMARNEADRIMQHLIENDSEYALLMRENVEKKWREANATTLSEVLQEIKKAERNLAAIRNDISTATDELSILIDKKEQFEAEANEAIQLQADVEKRIQERLLSIREERAKALVDEMWAMSASGTTSTIETSTKASVFIECDCTDDEIPEVSLDERLLDTNSIFLNMCGNNSRSIDLAVFFFAAYAVKQNLIITGECAEKISDTVAELITGKCCAKVQVDKNANVADVIREIDSVPHDYICFPNGLEQDYTVISAIMRHFACSRFIITVSHNESLTMEPASLFTTFLPVYSEEFCVNSRMQEYDLGSCKTNLSDAVGNPSGKQLRQYRNNQSIWFKNGFFAPMLIERCVLLHYALDILMKAWPDRDKNVKRAMLCQVYAPLMKALHRKDILDDNRIEFEILEPTQMTRLMAFMGIEKE